MLKNSKVVLFLSPLKDGQAGNFWTLLPIEEVKLEIYAFLISVVGGFSWPVLTFFQCFHLSLAAIRKADWTSCSQG